MSHTIKATLFGGALFCAGVADAKDTYRVDGPTTAATGSSYYSWDGGWGADFRGALENPSFFSHYVSYVDTSIRTDQFDYLAIPTLQRADCIVSTWWPDSQTTPYEAYVAAYHFWNGGDLLLFNDDSTHDYIAEVYLGIPTQDSASSFTFNDSTFPFDGPFGTTTSVSTSGNVGYLSDADVAATGGRVLARNGSGQIMVAFWDDNDFAPGAGRMLIVTDVNTLGPSISDYTPGSFNDSATFALNLVAGLIGPDPCNAADCDANGVLNVDDVECFVDTFLGGCP